MATKSQMKTLLKHITQFPGIQNKDLARLTGMSKGTVARSLTILRKEKAISTYPQKYKSPKTQRFFSIRRIWVSEDAARAAVEKKRRPNGKETRAIFLDFMKKANWFTALTNKELAEKTGLGERTISRIISTLVKQGEMTTEQRPIGVTSDRKYRMLFMKQMPGFKDGTAELMSWDPGKIKPPKLIDPDWTQTQRTTSEEASLIRSAFDTRRTESPEERAEREWFLETTGILALYNKTHAKARV